MDYKLPPENSSQLSDTPPKVLSDGLAASNFTAYSLFFCHVSHAGKENRDLNAYHERTSTQGGRSGVTPIHLIRYIGRVYSRNWPMRAQWAQWAPFFRKRGPRKEQLRRPGLK